MDIKKLDLGLGEDEIDIDEISTSFNKKEIDFNLIENKYSERKSTNELFNNIDEFEFKNDLNIKIFGIGGAGNNMVHHISNNSGIEKKSLFAINTDFQVLKKLPNEFNKILIGRDVTKGYGSGSDPLIGKEAAVEDKEIILKMLKGTDLLFIISGMGKGTGTGASPVIAQIAQELGILTIALVNLPSIMTEGYNIYNKGISGLSDLKEHCQGLTTISNEKIIKGDSLKECTLQDSFEKANHVIYEIINEIISLVTIPSEINIDFNDIKTFFKEKTNFQINNFSLDSLSDIKEEIKSKINLAIFDGGLNGSKKAIANFKLNPKVPNSFIGDIREVLEEMTGNKDIELTYATNYSEDIKFADFSLIIATSALIENNDVKASMEYVDKIQESFNKEEKKVCTNKLEIIKTEINEEDNYKITEKNMNTFEEEENFVSNNNVQSKLTAALVGDENEIKKANEEFIELQKEIQLAKENYNINSTEKSSILTKQMNMDNQSLNSTTLNRFIDKTLKLLKKDATTSKQLKNN